MLLTIQLTLNADSVTLGVVYEALGVFVISPSKPVLPDACASFCAAYKLSLSAVAVATRFRTRTRARAGPCLSLKLTTMMLALPRGFASAILLEKKTVTRSLSLLKQAGMRRASSPRPQLASTQLHLSRRRRRFSFSLPPLFRSHARHAAHLLPNLRRDERFPHLRLGNRVCVGASVGASQNVLFSV